VHEEGLGAHTLMSYQSSFVSVYLTWLLLSYSVCELAALHFERDGDTSRSLNFVPTSRRMLQQMGLS
jgi:hypothetical protein